MIASLVSVISLNLTLLLVQSYEVVAGTLPITGASVTTPINLTSPAHGFALGRVLHGVVTGVAGTVEANGLWVLTPVDANTLALSTFDAQGNAVSSVGVNAYLGGGQIQYAFPDGCILLGRRNVALATSVASPRIVFVPTDGKAWSLEPYGGASPNLQPASAPPVRGSAQAQAMALQPQLATEYVTFEVYVSASGPNFDNPVSPDFYDFEATQAIVHALYAVLFDASGPPRAQILHESWPSQKKEAGSTTQRGQQWCGILEMQQPVTRPPLSFVPIGTYLQITVQPENPGATDPVTFDVTQKNGP
jgi:hypothetical protein